MNEELKKAYEGIEDDLELVEFEGFYNHIKEWNFIKNYITNLQQENARLKEIENKLIFIKNRVKQGMSQENINKCAVELVNSYLKEN